MRDAAAVVLVAFGSNIEAERNLPRAAELLAERVELLAASTVYESPPVGAPGTPAFLNAVVRVASVLGPRSLKFDVLRSIEGRLGRRRSRDRNAPRTVDLDLVLFGDLVVSDLDLTLPDPDLARCAHVAVPAAEVAGEVVHPLRGETLARLAAELPSSLQARPDVRWPPGASGRTRSER